MTTDELLSELAARGLAVAIERGVPRLRGPRGAVTPVLLRVLRHHRLEILRRHGIDPSQLARPREWLWRFGHRYREEPADSFFGVPGHHPAGAWWWRHQGESEWQKVPGRTPEDATMPEAQHA